MGDCQLTPLQVQDFAARDNNRITGKIARAIARYAPYIDIFDGGTLDNNMGRVTRSVVAERAAMAQNLVKPTFSASYENCSPNLEPDQFGSREYSIERELLDGTTEDICVKQAETSFLGSYAAAQDSLQKGIVSLVNADARYEAIVRSGLKISLLSTVDFNSLLTGDTGDNATDWDGSKPDSFITFKALKRIVNQMKDAFLVEPFGMDGQQKDISTSVEMFKVILGQDAIDELMEREDVKLDMRAFVTGKYVIGERALNSFAFHGPYRNIGFAVDPQPLRASTFVAGESVDGGGVITNRAGAQNRFLVALVPGYTDVAFMSPVKKVAVTNGFAERTNPYWLQAEFEFLLVAGANAKERLVPKRWAGDGQVKFPDQLTPETLEFVVIKDNDCNKFGRNGRFQYSIERAYRPVQPHAHCGVIYRRCYPAPITICES